MNYSNQFFRALGIEPSNSADVRKYSKTTGISVATLRYHNDSNVLPTGKALEAILEASGISKLELALKMGRINKDILEAIQENASGVFELIKDFKPNVESPLIPHELKLKTEFGGLYEGDCYSLMQSMSSDSVDLIFADPPFNLSKLYPSNMDDNIRTEKYLHWCQEWLEECVRLLKPGGALFIWNLPKWNTYLSSYLNGLLTFRHWIGVDIKYGLPVQGRLYPSHYSLLYYVKGEKPNTFKPDRMPMATCSKCYSELKDYGGYKHKMNPLGINQTDIWLDIPPVRHAKYKRRLGSNELSLKLLDRIIEMSTNENDLVFDPFGGSGTTYVAAELKKRRWVGCELGPVDVIEERFKMLDTERKILNDYRASANSLFPSKILAEREKRNLWTPESVRKKDG